MKLRNWTPFVYLFPDRYVHDSLYFEQFSFESWSKQYEWEQDEFNGLLDFATEPKKTVETGRGDCEDYALVAASWLVSNDKDVSLAFCFEGALCKHVVAYEDDTVYSSGSIRDQTIDEYIEQSDYTWYLSRKL